MYIAAPHLSSPTRDRAQNLSHWTIREGPGLASFMRVYSPKENQTSQNQYRKLKLINVEWTEDITLPDMKLLLLARMRF